MKELIGFAVGAATGAAAAVLATAPEGRAFIDKVRADAEPELARAAVDLEPIARNVVRAAKLAMDDLGIATEGLRAWIAEAAAGVTPADVAAPSAEASPVPLLDAGHPAPDEPAVEVDPSGATDGEPQAAVGADSSGDAPADGSAEPGDATAQPE